MYLVPCFCFSYEIVFSNWLMMYLDDSECQKLIMKSILWLKEGGYFFMRESCFHGCGTALGGFRKKSKFCISEHMLPLILIKLDTHCQIWLISV